MSRLKSGLHRLKADPSARADDQDGRHGSCSRSARLARSHVRCRQLCRKVGGRLIIKLYFQPMAALPLLLLTVPTGLDQLYNPKASREPGLDLTECAKSSNGGGS